MVVKEGPSRTESKTSALIAITTAAVEFAQERNNGENAHALNVQLHYHDANLWLVDQSTPSEDGHLVLNRAQLSINPERLVDPESTSNQPVLQIMPDKYKFIPGDPNNFIRLTTPDKAKELSQTVALQTEQGRWRTYAEVKKDVVEKLSQVWDLAFTS